MTTLAGANTHVQKHQSVPRWFRMSFRVALMVGLVSLPALALKEASFAGLKKYKAYSSLFILMGTLALPLWEPRLGNIVLTFTLLTPLGLSAIWLAYGLFLACSHIIFMMGACVVVTLLVFFTSELLSMPVALLSVFATIFVAAANMHVQGPQLAYTVSVLLSVALMASAAIATLVSWLVFPEFCHDEVIMSHREGIEHLLHMAHYAIGREPPALAHNGVAVSQSAQFGDGSKWQQLLAAVDEQLPRHQAEQQHEFDRQHSKKLAQSGDVVPAASQQQLWQASYGVAGVTYVMRPQAWGVSRSWHRMQMALEAGANAEAGARAEALLAAGAQKRVIIPCMPLIPCFEGQLNGRALQALRHILMSAALDIYKLHAAVDPLQNTVHKSMCELTASIEWENMCNTLLAALQELATTFPVDYYPTRGSANQAQLQEYKRALEELKAAWGVQKGRAPTYHVYGRQQQNTADATVAAAMSMHTTPETGRRKHNVIAGGEEVPEPEFSQSTAHCQGTAALAQMHVLIIPKVLEGLCQKLEQLFSIAGLVSDSIQRCRC